MSLYSEYQYFLYETISELREKGMTFQEIAEHLNLPIWELYEVANHLKSHELIEELDKIT